MDDSDSDWLASDGEQNTPIQAMDMGARDRLKAERNFETDGWREGVSEGTAAALQPAFNQAFNTVGAPFGRRVGRARGTIDAIARSLKSFQSFIETSTSATIPPRSHHTPGADNDDVITSSSFSAQPLVDDLANAWRSQVGVLDTLATRLEKLDWKPLSFPIVDPHKDGGHGDHNNPPPDLDQQEEGHDEAPDLETMTRVEQARASLANLEQEVDQAAKSSLRLIARIHRAQQISSTSGTRSDPTADSQEASSPAAKPGLRSRARRTVGRTPQPKSEPSSAW